MPIRAHFAISAHLGAPPNVTLWKFLNAWKFMRVLASSALWFSSFQVLRHEDEAEGTVPQPNLVPPIEAFVDVVGVHVAHAVGVPEAVGEAFRALVENEQRLNLVTCWFMGDHPANHMWDRYAAERGAVALRSRTFDVAQALHHDGEDPEAYAFPCTYVDSTQAVTMKHFLAPFLVKRRAYQDEWEMRYLVRIPEPVHPGAEVAVHLGQLFDLVLVNTHRDDGVLDQVRHRIAEAGLTVPVEPRPEHG